MSVSAIRHDYESRYDEEWRAIGLLAYRNDWPESVRSAVKLAFVTQVAVEAAVLRRTFGRDEKRSITNWLRDKVSQIAHRSDADLVVTDDCLDVVEQSIHCSGEPLYHRSGNTIYVRVHPPTAEAIGFWKDANKRPSLVHLTATG